MRFAESRAPEARAVTRVLVVDDEVAVRDLMVEILAAAGYDTVAAETPAAARGLLDDPDLALVLSDVVMPGLSGLDLVDELRARPAAPSRSSS